ncbi:E3 ubiquitin-protein ligase MIB2-like isoform X2 [Pomacea canaliculata]|uniref:E3 ubiquitin-protein ligase MIB2-like isoform X2 n=1 Tax=Pomacea canaliculata TaxID=400727 RepID=UPI000D738899|nr:E3 ubiquitin-protein ligase MIB2-like isoform X2 [Pomacea canaliculata]
MSYSKHQTETLSPETFATVTMTTVVGMRVVRGPDWEGEDSDGGEAHVGTVMEVLGEYSVRVLWDTGVESTCRAGRDGKLDLRIFDTAPVGVRHLGETCAVCGEKDVCGMLWRCRDCDDCCLCTQCYCEDKHDVDHEFLRVDTPGSSGATVDSRSKSLKMQAVGIFPGAKVRKVTRYNNEEVYGSKGEVEGYETGVLYKCRNMLRVRWSDGILKNCCLGEIICIEEAAGPICYRDHLPLLDVTVRPFLEGLVMRCESELSPEDGHAIAFVTPSVSTDEMSGRVQHGTVINAHDESSTADIHPLSDVHDVGRHLLPENVAAITVGIAKDTDDGGRCCWSTQPSHESIMWLDKTYDTSDYNLTRNCDSEVTYNAVTSLRANIGQSTEDKGKFAEGLFDREATGLECDTTSRESEQPTNLQFEFANDCGKNDTLEINSDEEDETDEKERELQVNVGDSVAIKVGESRLEELQKTHGGCTQQMKQAIGMTGSVVTKTTKGSILVHFKSLGQYPFSPEALVKVSQAKQGEAVRIRPDKDQVKNLNRRVGWKDEMTLTLGKVGRVAKVDSDGDLLVIFGRSAFLYSPACCLPAPTEHTDSVVIPGKSITDRVTSSTSDVKDNSVQEKNKAMFLKMREMVLRQSSMSFIEQDDQVHDLFRAIYKGDIETVARLCGRNSSLLASCHQQLTPLMLASTRYSLEVVELLLDLGADINAVVAPSKTALGAAMEARREDICSLLIDRGADLTYLDHRKLSFLHRAAYQDLPMVIKTLAAYGLDINAKEKDMDTPLLVAVQRGAHRAMDALLSLSGIDVSAKNNRGFSALQLASQMGYDRVVPTSIFKTPEECGGPRYTSPAVRPVTVPPRFYFNSELMLMYKTDKETHLYI